MNGMERLCKSYAIKRSLNVVISIYNQYNARKRYLLKSVYLLINDQR